MLISPFMPAKAEELWAQLGAPGRAREQRLDALSRLDPTSWHVKKGESLFPRPDVGAKKS